jgi:hypothetical protein
MLPVAAGSDWSPGTPKSQNERLWPATKGIHGRVRFYIVLALYWFYVAYERMLGVAEFEPFLLDMEEVTGSSPVWPT